MSKYRARHCPKCKYFLGFSITKSPSRSREIFVTSFCLNCNYKLPVSRIVRGIRRTTSPLRRAALRLAAGKNLAPTNRSEAQRQVEDTEKPFSPLDYSRHLRVIGQNLEKRGLSRFNLECTKDAYLAWSLPNRATTGESSPSVSRNRLQQLWKNQARLHGHEERFTLPSSLPTKRYRYTFRDIERMEYESKNRRHPKRSVADGHSLSQLLRTVGAVVAQRRERLLGISWQDLSISIVVETAQGQRQIDVFRPDNLYDLWVRMYLRRDNRSLSDFPR